jgi:hypothetical protein
MAKLSFRMSGLDQGPVIEVDLDASERELVIMAAIALGVFAAWSWNK